MEFTVQNKKWINGSLPPATFLDSIKLMLTAQKKLGWYLRRVYIESDNNVNVGFTVQFNRNASPIPLVKAGFDPSTVLDLVDANDHDFDIMVGGQHFYVFVQNT